MAISAGDLTKLRYPYVRRKNTALNIKELNVDGSATIDTFSGGYPRTGYPVTGTSSGWADLGAGKLVRIMDSVTGDIKFEGITRIGNDASNVYIAAHAIGDTGLAREFGSAVAVGDDVEIYDVQPPITFQSILSADGILYKRATREFNVSVPQTSNPRPQVNIGSDKQFYTDDSTAVSVTLDASNSYGYLSGSSLTYQWVLPATATLTSGTLTDSSITIDLLPGNSRIRCRVTDSAVSGTNSSQGNRWYYVNAPTDNPAFSDQYAVEIGNFTVTRQGWTAQFTVSASEGWIPTSRLYTGAPVLFAYDIEYSADGSTWVTTDDESLSRRYFKGYLRSFDSVRYDRVGHIKRVTFTVESLYLYADALPIASQVIQYDATPDNWQQSPYTDINNLFYLITRYHNDTFNEDNDVELYADNANYITPLHAVNQGSMSSALSEVVDNRLGCNLGNRVDGAFTMKPHRSYENDVWRSAQDIRMTLTTRDLIMDSFSYQYNEIMKYGMTNGAFFLAGTTGTPLIGIRGLGAPMQGVSVNQTAGFVATTENDGLERIGHDHQNKNRRVESITLRLLNDGIIEPADMQAINFDLDALDAMEFDILNNTTWIPIEMRYAFPANGNNSVPPLIEVDFEPETKGEPAKKLEPLYSTYTWDFTANDGGWTVDNGSYVASTGFQGAVASTRYQVAIRQEKTAETTIQSVSVTVRMTSPPQVLFSSLGTPTNNDVIIYRDNVAIGNLSSAELDAKYSYFDTPFTTALITIEASEFNNPSDTEADEIFFRFSVATATGSNIVIESASITYTGTNNFTGGA